MHAWDLEQEVEEATINHQQYLVLLQRAASTVLGPFGVEESDIKEWIVRGEKPVRQLPLPPPKRRTKSPLSPAQPQTELPAVPPHRRLLGPQEGPAPTAGRPLL